MICTGVADESTVPARVSTLERNVCFSVYSSSFSRSASSLVKASALVMFVHGRDLAIGPEIDEGDPLLAQGVQSFLSQLRGFVPELDTDILVGRAPSENSRSTQFRFCPRQCALIHVERAWAENRLFVTEERVIEI